MRPIHRLLPTLLVLAGSARATPNFPQAIATHLGTSHVPPCSICHQGPETQGTATTPFAVSMLSRGLQPYQESALTTALDALAGEQTDSDGDGYPDLEELKNGWDPNFPSLPDGGDVPGGVRPNVLIPSYGCAIGRARAGASVEGSALGVLFAGVALVLRRRRRLRARLPSPSR